MSETKEQIRTELINELIEWFNKSESSWTWVSINKKLKSMLPTETPEKIAERKAVQMMSKQQPFASHGLEYYAESITKQMLIEALLTDLKK